MVSGGSPYLDQLAVEDADLELADLGGLVVLQPRNLKHEVHVLDAAREPQQVAVLQAKTK